MHEFKNLTIGVLGFAREGISSLQFLSAHFPANRFIILDERQALKLSEDHSSWLATLPHLEWALGGSYLDAVSRCDVIFKSAGVRSDLPELLAAEKQGALLTSNCDYFLQSFRNQVIGVTGTKGKSTTSSLIHHVLESGNRPTLLVGNIGKPPLCHFSQVKKDSIVVAELSSFQLSSVTVSPKISVIQNIVPEHLDYHGSFSNYVAAKANIARFQTTSDIILYNPNHEEPRRIAQLSQARKLYFSPHPNEQAAALVQDGAIYCRYQAAALEKVMDLSEVPLKGDFNLANVLPAVVIGVELGLSPEQLRAGIRSFQPLEHRLEFVGRYKNVEFFNDSLATVPDATIAALASFRAKPVVLIAGGHDRGIDYSQLAAVILDSRLKGLVLFRPTGEKIMEELQKLSASTLDAPLPSHSFASSMQEAVFKAHKFSQDDAVVLLSPGSASFGMFVDYQDRGEQFKTLAQKLCQQA